MKLPEQNMNALTSKELAMLKSIMEDKYARGPFVGMITNLSLSTPQAKPEWVLKKAMEIRLLIHDLTQ